MELLSHFCHFQPIFVWPLLPTFVYFQATFDPFVHILDASAAFGHFWLLLRCHFSHSFSSFGHFADFWRPLSAFCSFWAQLWPLSCCFLTTSCHLWHLLSTFGHLRPLLDHFKLLFDDFFLKKQKNGPKRSTVGCQKCAKEAKTGDKRSKLQKVFKRSQAWNTWTMPGDLGGISMFLQHWSTTTAVVGRSALVGTPPFGGPENDNQPWSYLVSSGLPWSALVDLVSRKCLFLGSTNPHIHLSTHPHKTRQNFFPPRHHTTRGVGDVQVGGSSVPPTSGRFLHFFDAVFERFQAPPKRHEILDSEVCGSFGQKSCRLALRGYLP